MSITEISTNLTRIKHNPLEFSFKDCWTIFCESLFPTHRDEYIGFATECLKYRLKKHIYVDAKIFIGNSFKNNWSMDGLPNYCLEQKQIEQYGLDKRLREKITARKFSNTYKSLTRHLPIDLLEEIISEISSFEGNFDLRFEYITNWIECTLNEVYSERNLETHNDIETELSLIKLKESFHFIINEVLRTIIALCNSKTTNIEAVRVKLELLNQS